MTEQAAEPAFNFRACAHPRWEGHQRVAFAPAFVLERILAEGMFDNLNTEARRAIYLIVDAYGLRDP